MKYRPEVDGLRSLAVLPVILFHGGVQLLSGGFVGVDVFFVISGYLITSIIIGDIEKARFSIANFYVRRSKRILPALSVVVLSCVPFAWVWMRPEQFKDFAQSISAVSVFSSNVLFWLESGYFAPTAEAKPLLHTWSLAVEEQYYIFFPLLLLLIWRRGGRVAIGVIGVILAISLGLSEYLWRHHPEANFYLLPSRAWELLVGSFCAVAQVKRGQWRSEALGMLGIAGVLGPVFVYDGDTPFPSLFALVPVVGAALIILFAAPGTWAARLLSTRPLVGIGLISYSAYLWHQPLFAFARVRTPFEPELGLMLGLSALSLGLAYLSWRFVEQPFRRPGGSAKVILGTTVVGSVAFCGLGVGLGYSGLQAQYFMASLSEQNRKVAAQIDRMQTFAHDQLLDDGQCKFEVKDPDASVEARFDRCHAEHGKAMVVFGDSHSADVYQGLSQATDYPFVVAVAQEACRPHTPDNVCTDSPAMKFMRGHGSQMHFAIYVQAGFWLLLDDEGQETGRHLFQTGDEPKGTPHEAHIARVVSFLDTLAESCPVYWLGPRFEPHIDFFRLLSVECDTDPAWLVPSPTHRELFKTLDDTLAEAAEGHRFEYVSEQQLVGYDPLKDYYTCGTMYWSDGDHWSPEGELRFGPRIARYFDRVRDAAAP